LVGLAGWALIGATLLSCKTIGLKEVFTSIDADGKRRRTTFYTDSQAIYCVIDMSSGRVDATIEAQFHQLQRYDYVKKAFVNAENATIVVGQDKVEQGETRMAFTMARPKIIDITTGKDVAQDGPYEPGQYTCEVLIEGKLEQRVTFNVLFPENGCPVTLAVSKRQCIGFYPEGVKCPGLPVIGGGNTECTCTVGGWECVEK
jgi:hypothetical protein